MQVQAGANSNHLKSRVINELPGVGRFNSERRRGSGSRSQVRYEALRTLYPDSDVAMRVLRALSDRNFSSLKELEVAVHLSEATITGEVNSFYEKQIAISSCQAVPGLLRLIDQIAVREYLDTRD